MDKITSLKSLATRVNAAHMAFVSSGQGTVEKAIDVGRLLAEVKALLHHGEWLPWIEANCEFSERTAQVYMRVFANRETRSTAADFQGSIRGLLRGLSKSESGAKSDPEPWTLFEGMDRVHDAVLRIMERWPEDKRHVLGSKLINMGREIIDTGNLCS
jgi:hypothetical protein